MAMNLRFVHFRMISSSRASAISSIGTLISFGAPKPGAGK
jgi:hypothetical protein